MKKSKIFMAAGAFVLTAAGILATKANKNFTAVTKGYIPDAFAGLVANTELPTFPAIGHFTNAGAGGNTAKTVHIALMTVGGHLITVSTLKTSTLGTANKVYWY